jgi:hypothetical protein
MPDLAEAVLKSGRNVRQRAEGSTPPKRNLRGAPLSEGGTRTGSTRVDGSHDAVVVIAVDAIRRSWPRTKTVTAGYRCVFAHREAALIDA